MSDTPMFLADGSSYDGPVFSDPKGRAFGEVTVACPSCRGRGEGIRGGRCRSCAGAKTAFDQALVYTADELSKRNVRSAKHRAGKMDAERDRLDRIASNHLDCVEANSSVYEGAKRWPGDRFIADLLAKSEVMGGLTEPQIAAMQNAVQRNDQDLARYGSSVAIGSEGDRIEAEMFCRRRVPFTRDRLYGVGKETAWFLELEDTEGNSLAAVTTSPDVVIDQAILVAGVVKSSDISKGWVRTLLSHFKIKDLVPEAAPKQRLA